jgi:hypothetical protein
VIKNSGNTVADDIDVTPENGFIDNRVDSPGPNPSPIPSGNIPGPPPALGAGDIWIDEGEVTIIDKDGNVGQGNFTPWIKFTIRYRTVFNDTISFVYCRRYRSWKSDDAYRWSPCETPYAAYIRKGRYRPHPRHWKAMAELAGVSADL